jgi:hypothetical protein
LVSELAGRLDGLAQLSGIRLAVEHVGDEGVLGPMLWFMLEILPPHKWAASTKNSYSFLAMFWPMPLSIFFNT